MTKTLEEIRNTPEAERTPEEIAALSAAERKTEEPQEHMIPKSRLDEVIKERDRLKKEKEDSETKRLQEQGQWQTLAEQRKAEIERLTSEAEKVTSYEDALKRNLQSQLEDIPVELRKLVPEALSTVQKLEWLSTNKSILLKPAAFDIGAGGQGNNERGRKKIELTPEQRSVAELFGMSEEEYAKFSAGPDEAFSKEK